MASASDSVELGNADTFLGDDALQLVEASPAKGTRSSSVAGTSAETVPEPCFLCEIHEGELHRYKGRLFHILCKKACLCHTRQLSLLPEPGRVRQKDSEMMQNQPAQWREIVHPLLMSEVGAVRSTELLQQHSDAVSRCSYVDNSTLKGRVLLTKTRFCQWQKANEGCGSETASESFDRRLDEASTENACSEESDQPQVAVRENTRLQNRHGTVTQTRHRSSNSSRTGTRHSVRDREKGSNRTSRGRSSGHRNPRNASTSELGRSRSRHHTASARSVRGRHESGATPSRSPLPASSPPSKGVQVKQERHTSGAGSSRRRPGTASLRPASRPALKRGASSANLEVPEEDEAPSNPALSFLQRTKHLKKDLEAASRLFRGVRGNKK